MKIKGKKIYITFDELRREGFLPIFLLGENKESVAKFMVNRFNQDNNTKYEYSTIVGISNGMIIIEVNCYLE